MERDTVDQLSSFGRQFRQQPEGSAHRGLTGPEFAVFGRCVCAPHGVESWPWLAGPMAMSNLSWSNLVCYVSQRCLQHHTILQNFPATIQYSKRVVALLVVWSFMVPVVINILGKHGLFGNSTISKNISRPVSKSRYGWCNLSMQFDDFNCLSCIFSLFSLRFSQFIIKISNSEFLFGVLPPDPFFRILRSNFCFCARR